MHVLIIEDSLDLVAKVGEFLKSRGLPWTMHSMA
jgi:hypothetical protein